MIDNLYLFIYLYICHLFVISLKGNLIIIVLKSQVSVNKLIKQQLFLLIGTFTPDFS